MNKALKALSKKASSSKPSRSRVEVTKIVPKSLQKLVDDYAKLDAKRKEVQGELEVVRDKLLPQATALVENELERSGKQSLRIPGELHELMVVIQDKWGYITDKELRLAKKLLGKHFDDLVDPEVSLQVKPEVAKDPERMNKLLKQLGPLLDEYFEVTVRYRPAKGFLKAIYSWFPTKRVKKIKDIFRHATPQLRVIK